MNFFKIARKVQKEEDGAVTVDWVVLTAAVVVLGAIVMAAIKDNVSTLATDIGTYLTKQDATLQANTPK